MATPLVRLMEATRRHRRIADQTVIQTVELIHLPRTLRHKGRVGRLIKATAHHPPTEAHHLQVAHLEHLTTATVIMARGQASLHRHPHQLQQVQHLVDLRLLPRRQWRAAVLRLLDHLHPHPIKIRMANSRLITISIRFVKRLVFDVICVLFHILLTLLFLKCVKNCLLFPLLSVPRYTLLQPKPGMPPTSAASASPAGGPPPPSQHPAPPTTGPPSGPLPGPPSSLTPTPPVGIHAGPPVVKGPPLPPPGPPGMMSLRPTGPPPPPSGSNAQAPPPPPPQVCTPRKSSQQYFLFFSPFCFIVWLSCEHLFSFLDYFCILNK